MVVLAGQSQVSEGFRRNVQVRQNLEAFTKGRSWQDHFKAASRSGLGHEARKEDLQLRASVSL